MPFLLANLIIFLSLYCLSVQLRIKHLSHKLIFIVLWGSVQIILTQLMLGILGWLDLPVLVLLNLAIASLLFCWGKRRGGSLIFPTLKSDLTNSLNWLKTISSGPNLFLIFLALLVTVWCLLASFLLPPRGVDDLGHHLTIVYEYVSTHKIYLLPIELRSHFAFAQNAELLFVWPTIFFHNTAFIGLVQFFFSFVGVLALYAIGRILSWDAKTSFFIAIQFLFAPLVLAQAGSGYIDTIVAVFYGMGLFFALRYHREKRDIDLYSTAMATGLMLGMKYGLFLPAFFLQILVLPGLRLDKKKKFLLYLLLVALGGGYWYIRNLALLGNPFYPIDVWKGSSGGIFPAEEAKNLLSHIHDIFRKLKAMIFYDTGLRSLHGGFGLTFWGMVLPSWIYMFLKSCQNDRTDRPWRLFLWSQFLLWLGQLVLFVPYSEFYLTARYSIALIPLGLLALGEVIRLFEKRIIYRALIKISCCLFAVLAVIQLAKVKIPSYAVDAPINDILEGTIVSKNKYLRLSSYMPTLSYAWEALDRLTQDDPQGLDVYMAADSGFYWPAPTYGNHLQNRIWNFQENPRGAPDAYLYHYEFKLYGGTQRLFYLGKKIPPGQIATDERYDLIVNIEGTFLFILKDYLVNKKDILANFYHDYFSAEIKALRDTGIILEKGVPVIDSSAFGYAMKYWEVIRMGENPVYLFSPAADVLNDLILKNGWRAVYTLNEPLANRGAQKIYEGRVLDTPLTIYKNFIK